MKVSGKRMVNGHDSETSDWSVVSSPVLSLVHFDNGRSLETAKLSGANLKNPQIFGKKLDLLEISTVGVETFFILCSMSKNFQSYII